MIKRPAERFRLREAENSRGAAVPQPDQPFRICIDDCIRHAGNEAVGKLRLV
jgi:hypothetical protein